MSNAESTPPATPTQKLPTIASLFAARDAANKAEEERRKEHKKRFDHETLQLVLNTIRSRHNMTLVDVDGKRGYRIRFDTRVILGDSLRTFNDFICIHPALKNEIERDVQATWRIDGDYVVLLVMEV